MIRNIDILLNIKGLITQYQFLLDDISVRSELGNKPMDEMISKCDDDILAFLNVISDIDKCLVALTEDLRDSLSGEGFDCEDYSKWTMRIIYDPMSLTGLLETFTEVLKHLELYILETIRGYRILTQPAYKQESLHSELAKKTFERRTE